jgi:exopolysaccharide biosynthesis polyprenyl glycosylphosphotransferase
MVLQVPIDYLMLLFAAMSAFALRFSDWAIALRPVQFSLTFEGFMSIAAQVGLAWIIIFAFSGLYKPDPHQKLANTLSQIFFACSTGLAFVALYLLFAQQPFDSRFLVAAGWVFSILFVFTGRLLMRAIKALLYRANIGLVNVVLIGDLKLASTIQAELESRSELGYRVLDVYQSFDDAVAADILACGADEILFVHPRAREHEAIEALEWAQEHHIGFQYSADLFATFAANVRMHPIAGIPIVEIRRTKLDGWGRVVKRLFDIVMSLFFIVLFSPIMLITAIAIKLDSKGSVLFSYKRVGEHGQLFTYCKFRSMVINAHELRYDEQFRSEVEDTRGWTEENPIIKYKDDPRITRVGKFIRRWSIDEFPEFFLVLIGRMSLVGPRPHEEKEVAKYKRQHKRVLSVKPGITGLAQISGRSDLSFDEEVRLDVFYIEHWTVILDIVIVLKTPFILFKKRSAL